MVAAYLVVFIVGGEAELELLGFTR